MSDFTKEQIEFLKLNVKLETLENGEIAIAEIESSILHKLCRRQLRLLSDNYPMPTHQLIRYHDFMALESSIQPESVNQQRVLNVSLSTTKALVSFLARPFAYSATID